MDDEALKTTAWLLEGTHWKGHDPTYESSGKAEEDAAEIVAEIMSAPWVNDADAYLYVGIGGEHRVPNPEAFASFKYPSSVLVWEAGRPPTPYISELQKNGVECCVCKRFTDPNATNICERIVHTKLTALQARGEIKCTLNWVQSGTGGCRASIQPTYSLFKTYGRTGPGTLFKLAGSCE